MAQKLRSPDLMDDVFILQVSIRCCGKQTMSKISSWLYKGQV